MAIDYGLDVRQAAIDRFTQAEAGRARAVAERKARDEKAARQKRKGLMTLALHGGAAVATGGASLPYSAKYGALANKALMGDDYEGSGVDALQGLGSMVYKGAEGAKAKHLAGMEKSYNQQLEQIYASIDSLPPNQVMERARLANNAASLTNTYEDNVDAAEKKGAWEYLTSEREKMTQRTSGSGAGTGYIDPEKISMGTKVAEVAEARGKETTPDKDFMSMTPQDYQSMEEARKVVETPYYEEKQLRQMNTGLLSDLDQRRYDRVRSPRQEAVVRNQMKPIEEKYDNMLSPREESKRRNRRRYLPQGGLGTGVI